MKLQLQILTATSLAHALTPTVPWTARSTHRAPPLTTAHAECCERYAAEENTLSALKKFATGNLET